MEQLAITSSIELQSVYSKGFEEWKPSQTWAFANQRLRMMVCDAFREAYRTPIFTATGMIYTELVEQSAQNELTVNGVIFTKHERLPDKPKFLIRLQHALEHQLAMALYKANFTRLSGETTPMYVFMNQSSGKEIKLQTGKAIVNYCGIVPHVKIRSSSECHLEMVPAEKAFQKKTVRDLCVSGRVKQNFKDTKGLVRTQGKLLTVTILSISNEQSRDAKDPTTGLTVREMATKRGCGSALSYNDAVVVETTHGLFSSDEIHPSARLSKKEQASRDTKLGKHRYADKQKIQFAIVNQFKQELCESIRRYDIGLRVTEDFIYAPCTYLPEVQIRRCDAANGESIGSKCRKREWDRILRKPPANYNLKDLVVIIDRSYSREKGSLLRLFKAVIKKRPWVPEPKIFVGHLEEICKVWTTRQTNAIRYTCDKPIDSKKVADFFKEFGLVSNVTKVQDRTGVVNFRNASCVPGILSKGFYKIQNKKVKVECVFKMSRHQTKICTPTFDAIKAAEALIIFLPGKEGSARVTHMKNKLTMLINGEEGLNACALQFIMQFRRDNRKSFPILQEAIEAGLIPKTGAITFEIVGKKTDYDLILAIDISQENKEHGRVASIVGTNKPLEGSIAAMKSIVSLVDQKEKNGDIIPYTQMKRLLKELGLKGKNILIYRHNCCVEYKDVHANEIQGAIDHFKGCHISFVEVTSTCSLRIFDIPHRNLGSKQAKGEFIITKKVTQTWKKALEFYIRHIEKSNPVKYSLIYSTNRALLTIDSEIVNLAIFTHNTTKNYVHHKDGSKLPGPLKYADHIARLYSSIMKTTNSKTLPKFSSRSLRPKIV
eukprot:UN23013